MMQVAGGMDRLPAALAGAPGQPHRVSRGRARDSPERTRRLGDLCRCRWAGAARRRRLLRLHDPLPVLSGLQKDSHHRCSRPSPRRVMTARARSACSSGAASGNRTTRFTAANHGPDREIGQILYPSHGFRGRKGLLVGFFLDFRGRWAIGLPPTSAAGAGAGRAYPPAVPRPSSRRRFPSGGLACHGTAAHGGPNRPRRLRRSRALRHPDGRVHFAGDYMTGMSSWMQGAFESARDVAAAIHRRVPTRG